MKPAKEYSILPQCERDGGYIIRPENDPVKKKSCVLISFVILAVLIIISGAFALVVGLFYSQEFTSTVNTYWNKGHANLSSSNKTSGGGSGLQQPEGGLDSSKSQILQNDTVTIPNLTTQRPENTENATKDEGEGGTGDGDGRVAPKKDKDVGDDDESLPTTTPKPATSDSGADEDEEDDERETENDEETDDNELEMDHHSLTTTTTTTPSTTTTPAPAITEHPTKKTKPKHSKHNSTKQGIDRKEEFAETMQEVEKYFESVTGIRRAEFVIPLMMLLVFVVALAFSSCCCYLILKRKDKQRRKDLGKMITDLQAGDKSILLDQDVDE